MRKFYKNDGIEVPTKIKNKDYFFELVFLFITLYASIINILDFLRTSIF